MSALYACIAAGQQTPLRLGIGMIVWTSTIYARNTYQAANRDKSVSNEAVYNNVAPVYNDPSAWLSKNIFIHQEWVLSHEIMDQR